MGIGIQIKKPDHLKSDSILEPLTPQSSNSLPPLFYLMMGLTIPAALLALYFLFQARSL